VIEARRATPGDADAIAALVEAAYAGYVERIGRRPAPMDTDYATEIAEREVWVVPGEIGIVGVLVVHAEPNHLFVHNIAVDPALQGHGLGASLLELAERRAAELGLRELRLLTNELMTENRAMYAHLGWEETEVRAEHGYRRVYFRKRLAEPLATAVTRCEEWTCRER
jgi:N-acetylglutamate synthase-like GNAT family acetyltransferase